MVYALLVIIHLHANRDAANKRRPPCGGRRVSERGGICWNYLARDEFNRRGVLGVANAVSLVRLEGLLFYFYGYLTEQEVFSWFYGTISSQSRELVTSLGNSVLALAVCRLDKESSLDSKPRLFVRGLGLLGREPADDYICVLDYFVHSDALYPLWASTQIGTLLTPLVKDTRRKAGVRGAPAAGTDGDGYDWGGAGHAPVRTVG